jgi:hypothetical protein
MSDEPDHYEKIKKDLIKKIEEGKNPYKDGGYDSQNIEEDEPPKEQSKKSKDKS